MTRLMPESARKLPAMRRANHRHRGSPPTSSAARPRLSRSKAKWKTTIAASATPRAASIAAKRGEPSASRRCAARIELRRSMTERPAANGMGAPSGRIREGAPRARARRRRHPGASASSGRRAPLPPASACSDEAQEVALAELDAVVAQEGIGGGRVKVEIRQGEEQQIIAALHMRVLARDLQRDVLVLGAVDLLGFQPVDEGERRRDTGLQFREARFLVLMLGRFDAGEPGAAVL